MAKSFCCAYGMQMIALETAAEKTCFMGPGGKQKYIFLLLQSR
jgi:hypothetical protein